MQPNLIMCNVNNADIMPCGITHAASPNDLMHGSCDMHTLVSWAFLCSSNVPYFLIDMDCHIL